MTGRVSLGIGTEGRLLSYKMPDSTAIDVKPRPAKCRPPRRDALFTLTSTSCRVSLRHPQLPDLRGASYTLSRPPLNRISPSTSNNYLPSMEVIRRGSSVSPVSSSKCLSGALDLGMEMNLCGLLSADSLLWAAVMVSSKVSSSYIYV